MDWKRIVLLFAVAAMVCCCNELPQQGGISITQDNVNFKAAGGRARLDFTATGDWSAKLTGDSWCKIVPDEGIAGDATVMITAEANNTPDERTSELVITCGMSTETISVVQEALSMVTVSQEQLHSGAEGGSYEVSVEHNINFSTLISSGAEGWLSVAPASKALSTSKINIQVAANQSGWLRKGEVIVTSDIGDTRIAVTQDGADTFSLSSMSETVPGTGGTFTISVSGSRPYHISSMPDWITQISVDERTHTFEAPVFYGDSPRSDYIIFCDDGGVCLPFEITQECLPEWASKGFAHTSLVMRFTATWCGWCPRMNKSVKKAQQLYPEKLHHLALHGSGSTLYFAPVSDLMTQYAIKGYPTGMVDGRIEINNGDINATAQNIVSAAQETEAQYGTVSGASVKSTLSGSDLSIDLTLYLREAGKYKVTVLLTEDGINAGQEDYEDVYHSSYTHDGVARTAVTSVLGESFSVDKDFTTKNFRYNAKLSSSWNTSKVRILVYIQAQYGSRKKIRSGNYGDYYVDNCFVAVPGQDLPLKTQ